MLFLKYIVVPLCRPIDSLKDPYLVLKWAEQEARTTVKRNSGKECSWAKEELVLLVRAKKQLQQAVEVEVRVGGWGHDRCFKIYRDNDDSFRGLFVELTS